MTPLQKVQEALGVVADDIWGIKSQGALDREIAASVTRRAPKVAPPAGISVGAVDERSEKNIATLLPKVQPLARWLVRAAAAKGILIKVTSGTRTYEEQNALFAKGNVTKARGGYSNHNFGLAFDVTVFKADNKTPIWDGPQYDVVGKLGKEVALTWGGDWKSFVDKPHFQYTPKWATNMSEATMLAELRRRKSNGIPYLV